MRLHSCHQFQQGSTGTKITLSYKRKWWLLTNLTLPNNNGINLKLTACKIVNTRPCKMVRPAFFLSFAWVANSRPRNSRDFAAQIIWLTDFRARDCSQCTWECKKGASASTTTTASEFVYFQTLSRLFSSLRMSHVDEFPLEFISWGPHLSWERARKKNSSSLVYFLHKPWN